MFTYHLSILTPQGEIFNGRVASLTARGQLGEFSVLANHAPMAVALSKGVIRILVNIGEKEALFAHETGVLEVRSSHDVLVLVDHAFPVEDIKEGKEKLSALADTQKSLAG